MGHAGKQGGQHAQTLQQAAQTQGENHDGLAEKHAFHAAARHEFTHRAQIQPFSRFVTAEKPAAQLPQRGAAVDIGNGDGGENGGDDGVDGVDFAHRQHNQHHKRQQGIAVHEAAGHQLLLHGGDVRQICIGHVAGEQPQQDCGQYPGGNGGEHHIADVVEQIHAHNRGGDGGGVGQGRHFVAE